MLSFETVSQSRCFGGTQFVHRHTSRETGTSMRLAAFVPPQAERGKVPVVWFLSGLTCTEENFTVKAGAQRVASELGLMLIAPDTSPRGEGVPESVLAPATATAAAPAAAAEVPRGTSRLRQRIETDPLRPRHLVTVWGVGYRLDP